MDNQSSPVLFDRALVRQHLTRAMPNFVRHKVLCDDAAAQINERLSEVRREFDRTLDLSPFPFLAQNLKTPSIVSLPDSASDNESLSLSPQSFDLVVSNLGLHWVNDVPGTLAQIRTALKPDGLFLASLIGGESLRELRACLLDGELVTTGGVSPRLSPTIDLPTASALMRRAGFSLPVADCDIVTLLYPDMFALMRDLRGMGQTNALVTRLRRFTRRTVFDTAAQLYKERFANKEGLIHATFEIIYLHGWK